MYLGLTGYNHESSAALVDENGYLQEPFFLLPIGFICICLSMILYLIFAIAKKK